MENLVRRISQLKSLTQGEQLVKDSEQQINLDNLREIEQLALLLLRQIFYEASSELDQKIVQVISIFSIFDMHGYEFDWIDKPMRPLQQVLNTYAQIFNEDELTGVLAAGQSTFSQLLEP